MRIMREDVKGVKYRFWALLLLVLLCIPLSACSENQKSADTASEPAAGAESKAPEQSFPFKDDEGRMRYKLEINGTEVQTENLPFTYPNEPKGGYYPLEHVLSHLGVACLCSEDESTLTTKINGKVLTVSAGVAEMIYGKTKVKSDTAAPVNIDGCLYVPSFLFMILFDDGVVDFSSDRSTATLETNATIDLASSGTVGLSIPSVGTLGNVAAGSGSAGKAERSICPVCNAKGKSVCTYCGGTGSKIEYQQTYDPVSKTYKQTQKRVFCPRCGGSGQVTCPGCGGSGKK
jgi:hypothetical protein